MKKLENKGKTGPAARDAAGRFFFVQFHEENCEALQLAQEIHEKTDKFLDVAQDVKLLLK